MKTIQEAKIRRDALLAMEAASEALVKLSTANCPPAAAATMFKVIWDSILSAPGGAAYAEAIISRLRQDIDEWKAAHSTTVH
jgi:hypothetical protein